MYCLKKKLIARSSFNLLDKQGLHKKFKLNPDYFMFNWKVVSYPAQILVTVFNLSLTLNDVINSIKIDNEKGIELTTNIKILIENYSAKAADGVTIKIKDENHTMVINYNIT